LRHVRSSEVVKAIEDILPGLGNPIVRGNEKDGVLGTGFYDRSHISARWRDRYIISVGITTSNETAVMVFRELLISRGKVLPLRINASECLRISYPA
jgi:hypothetical protein